MGNIKKEGWPNESQVKNFLVILLDHTTIEYIPREYDVYPHIILTLLNNMRTGQS